MRQTIYNTSRAAWVIESLRVLSPSSAFDPAVWAAATPLLSVWSPTKENRDDGEMQIVR